MVQFFLYADSEVAWVRRLRDPLLHLGRMTDNHDETEGQTGDPSESPLSSIAPSPHGIRRPQSDASDQSGNPAPHVSRRLEDETSNKPCVTEKNSDAFHPDAAARKAYSGQREAMNRTSTFP